MMNYRTIADALAADISSGCLAPGARLPPQREFAHRNGIAVSTASRVYGELVRRGLVTGEVGRGTYVRALPGPPLLGLTEPAREPVDLEMNFPILPNQTAELADALAPLLRPHALARGLGPGVTAPPPPSREIAAGFTARGGWTPGPESMLFCASGRAAIAASLAALGGPGTRIGIEAVTYPVLKGVAARLGIELVPLALDAEGLTPDAVIAAHRAGPLKGLYVQPSLHNPLGITMGERRRARLAAVLVDTGLVAVEDAIYGFLVDEAPLARLAPGNTILVDSLSKRLAPGLSFGLVTAPPHLVDRIASAIRSGGWAAAGFAVAAGLQWMSDGTAARIAAAKRDDAAHRQAIARDVLDGFALGGDPRAYHLWWELPDGWRAEAFAAAAARRGIAITPAGAFTVVAGHAPSAVRLALASPTPDALAEALRTLRRLAAADPGDSPVE